MYFPFFQVDYAKRREENLRLNKEFLSQFGLDEVSKRYLFLRGESEKGLSTEELN